MRTRVQKWGNSLALRIPKPFAAEVKVTEDTPVELTVEDGKLIIAPVRNTVPTLEEMVAQITPENRHEEWDTGPAVGREVW